MSARIYVEGGGDSNEVRTRCREAFSRLFKACGFSGRLPSVIACGGRDDALDRFTTVHGSASQDTFVCMLVDSEDPVADVERPWAHLKQRDTWDKPESAEDEQVFLMATCMETWIVADPDGLKVHYGKNFQQSALPALNNLESRGRDDVQDALTHATRNCQNAYRKGKRSFAVLGKLNPKELEENLPSFKRMTSILDRRL